MRFHTRRFATVATVVAASAAGASAMALGGASAGARPRAETRQFETSSSTELMTEFPEKAAAFSALRRAPNAADAALRGLHVQAPVAGARTDLVRSVYSDASARLGIFPAANGVVCFVASLATGAIVGLCHSTPAAIQHGLQMATGAPGTGYSLWGVLPDGSHDVTITDSQGSSTGVALSSDGGYSFESAVKPVTFSWLDSANVVHQSTIYFGDGNAPQVAPPGVIPPGS
jgi:hypothetical protein